jgi:hypothetical protein
MVLLPGLLNVQVLRKSLRGDGRFGK